MTNNPPQVDVETPAAPFIAKPLLLDFVYVCHRLPEDQRRQWVALSDGQPYDAERMAVSLYSRVCPKWALIDVDTTPLAIGGYDMIREGVWQDWLIGTEDAWQRHWRAITKHCKRVMQMMLEREAHRLQTVALADRTMAHKWFRALGLQYEGTLRAYGYNGEDCMMFARINRGGEHGRE